MNKPIPELTERQLQNFWRKIDKRGPDDCWQWLAGTRTRKGYGQFAIDGAPYIATRVVYSLTTGTDAGTRLVCHKCDNPGCCNPAHLFLGTSKDNLQDMVRKGRKVVTPLPGEKNGRSVLTGRDVLAIRRSSQTTVELAAKYGVSHPMISMIKSRKRWKHI